jgi:hypothetical protein
VKVLELGASDVVEFAMSKRDGWDGIGVRLIVML